MKRILTTREHYDHLADSGHGSDDPPWMDDYMARWDGPPFFDAIGNVAGKTVLDVGVGNGRIARIILDRGCSYFTGLDLSARTLEKTKLNLGDGALVYDSAVVLNAVTKDGVVTFKSSFHSLGMILPEPG